MEAYEWRITNDRIDLPQTARFQTEEVSEHQVVFFDSELVVELTDYFTVNYWVNLAAE
jgi:hypothetical protein